MLKYIAKRVLWLIPVIIGVSLIIFTIMYFKPGNPAQLILGSEATQAEIDALTEEMGLNDPFLVQYADYMKGLLHGDLGTSWRNGNRVSAEILSRFPVTLELAALSILLVCLIGIPIGVISAVRQYSVLDMVSVVTALALASMPSFWIGLMLMLLFSVQLELLPPTGADSFINFILPSITLAAVNLAVITRMTRSTMLEVIRQDYVRTAKAKGAGEVRIVMKHCLKNAMIPVLTIVAIQFSNLVGGAVLVESVFAMPGLGTLLVQAIRSSDTPLIMGSVIVLASIFTILNLVIDLLYSVIDPRIKAQFAK